jgi:heterodisulfide reductase subunit C
MGVPTVSEAPLPVEMNLDNLFQFPEGRKILACIQCGTCAGTCPYGDVLDYSPRRIVPMLRAGNPIGESSRKRADWVTTASVPVRILAQDPRSVDVLWFVKCRTAYHPRGQDHMLMDYDTAVFQRYKVNPVVTSGVHAYDAFKRQYPSLGFSNDIHHTTPFPAG